MYTQEQVERMHADVAHANRVKLPLSTAGQLELEGMLRAYAATLKAAQGGEVILPAALSAQQQETPCSLDEALAVIEAWASHGGQVHGNAATRFRALVDRIAPQQQQGLGEAVACIDPRHLALLRKDWRQGNCLKHPEDAVAGDVLLYTPPPAQPAVPEGYALTLVRNGLIRVSETNGTKQDPGQSALIDRSRYPIEYGLLNAMLAATPGDGKEVVR